MIRFVDLTDAYWTDPNERTPLCAFLHTANNRFIENDLLSHVCADMEDVCSMGEGGCYGERCTGLVPSGFFGPVKP